MDDAGQSYAVGIVRMSHVIVRYSIAIGFLVHALAASGAEPTLTAEQQHGKALFEATCNYCHNARGWATERLKVRNGEDRAVLAERSDLDPAYIRTVVRNGLVSMPAYTPTDLDEAQIRAIAAYLARPQPRSRN